MNQANLAELFGSVDRFRALRTLFAEPERGFGQRELAKEAGLDPGNLSRLLKRWTGAGIVRRVQNEGLPRYYAAKDPSLAPLVALMRQDSLPARTLRDFLARVDGIDSAVIFGSIARGQENVDSDIDLLVLGRVSELKLNTLLKPVGRQLGRAIHASVSTVEDFTAQMRAGEGFAMEVWRSPKINLIGRLDDEDFSGTDRLS